MQIRLLRPLLLVSLMCFHPPTSADEILIIVARNSSVAKLTAKQLADIYRKKTLLNENDERWIPVNLKIDDPLRLAFSEKIFRQRPEDMEAFWNIQYFKGITPPYVVSSNEAVLRFVASAPNAIGYIHDCYLDERVRVVLKLHFVSSSEYSCP